MFGIDLSQIGPAVATIVVGAAALFGVSLQTRTTVKTAQQMGTSAYVGTLEHDVVSLREMIVELSKRLDSLSDNLQESRERELKCERDRQRLEDSLDDCHETNATLTVRVQTLAARVTELEKGHDDLPKAVGWE